MDSLRRRIDEAVRRPRLQYLGQCDALRRKPGGEQNWKEMMRLREPATKAEFKRSVELHMILDPKETLEQFVADDPTAAFFRSVWGDKPCYFMQTAGFEFIWV